MNVQKDKKIKNDDELELDELELIAAEIHLNDYFKKRVIPPLLHLFLPLDIDMQALKMIKNNTEKAQKYREEMFQTRSSDKHYRQKLYDLWYLLGEKGDGTLKPSPEAYKLIPIGDLKGKNTLRRLAGLDNKNPKESPIYKFLEYLDTVMKDNKSIANEITYLLKPFNENNIKSFYDWYRALDECLKDKKTEI